MRVSRPPRRSTPRAVRRILDPIDPIAPLPRFGAGVSKRVDMEIRRITEKHARRCDGRRRCTERRDRDLELEPPYQLLKHENRARHRCVERGGKASTRTSRKQYPTIWPLAAEDFSDKVGNTRPHLYARTLATERKPGADCEHTAAEFHPDEVKRRLRDFLVQHGLDMGDAASRCVR